VSFVGTLTVFVTYPAEKAVYSDGTAIVAPAGALLPVTSGGTGASTAADARTALGLGTIATQAANSVAITGGAIDGTTVGATTVAAGSFSALNSSGNTRLGGLSGNQSLQVNNVASAVNYAQIVGSVAGSSPSISAQGTDANPSLILTGKGTGVVAFGGTTVANSSLQVATTASSVNYAQISGNAVGFGPIIAAQGTDANIAFTMRSKGTFGVTFQSSAGSNIADFLPTFLGFGVNFPRFTNAIAGSSPSISAQGSDANINLILTPKGTGVLQFGTYTAGILAQAGYITITDAGGTSRRLLVG
jgi:hypothetical protein